MNLTCKVALGKKYFKINIPNEEPNLENFAWHLFINNKEMKFGADESLHSLGNLFSGTVSRFQMPKLGTSLQYK